MANNKDPAILFYTADFLVGAQGLTMEERGQYITLLCLQHQQGHLSEKTMRLAVGDLSEDVKSKFLIDENGLYYQKRMEEEKVKRDSFIFSRQENGKKGGRPSKPKLKENLVVNLEKTYDKPNGKATENLPENENINVNINVNRNISIKHKYGSYNNVLLTDEECEKLKVEFPADYSDRIERLSEYIASSGKKYKSHLATIRSWSRKEPPKPPPIISEKNFDANEAFMAALKRTYK